MQSVINGIYKYKCKLYFLPGRGPTGTWSKITDHVNVHVKNLENVINTFVFHTDQIYISDNCGTI